MSTPENAVLVVLATATSVPSLHPQDETHMAAQPPIPVEARFVFTSRARLQRVYDFQGHDTVDVDLHVLARTNDLNVQAFGSKDEMAVFKVPAGDDRVLQPP